MTREEIEKYHDIAVRLKLLTSTIVTDTVAGSVDEYPFTCHPISIHGLRKDDKTLREIKLLTQQKSEIDNFIDGLEDVRLKTIVELYIKQNLTWVQAGRRMGESPDAVRMCYSRNFPK